jgi:DNA-directed RNA polymerase alpha subunit/DNA-directed RNA polymerase subunit L
MNPAISNYSEESGELTKFTISGINVSFVNALRRIILSEIPTVVFRTETYKDNQCTISINTTRTHNEIIKQRLSCIPVHMTDLDILPNKYILEVDVKNETENIMFVTTEDFKIKNKSNGNYLTKEETHKIFPSNMKTNSYIDFARLRPKISDTIPGEQLKLTAEFSISTAKTNSMFNVVSKCSYGNTLDFEKINQEWNEMETKLKLQGGDDLVQLKKDIEFQKKNFYILDAQRRFIENSFDFVIQTIGVFENKTILKMGLQILQNKFIEFKKSLETDIVPILNSETTMDNCYDIILEDEDYTIGKVIEYILYEKYYHNDKSLDYCGFKKFHPHDKHSTIRVAFAKNADKSFVKQILFVACENAKDIFQQMHKLF